MSEYRLRIASELINLVIQIKVLELESLYYESIWTNEHLWECELMYVESAGNNEFLLE